MIDVVDIVYLLNEKKFIFCMYIGQIHYERGPVNIKKTSDSLMLTFDLPTLILETLAFCTGLRSFFPLVDPG